MFLVSTLTEYTINKSSHKTNTFKRIIVIEGLTMELNNNNSFILYFINKTKSLNSMDYIKEKLKNTIYEDKMDIKYINTDDMGVLGEICIRFCSTPDTVTNILSDYETNETGMPEWTSMLLIYDFTTITDIKGYAVIHNETN